MKKKKLLIPIVFTVILSVAIFSGCFAIDLLKEPIAAHSDIDNYDQRIDLTGHWSLLCKAKDFKIVYDKETHDNWEDYNHIRTAGSNEHYRVFSISLFQRDVDYGVTYYWRAVAYCYDFKGRFRNLEEGIYQTEEQTFISDF
jgi:hypothetical protein